MVQGLGFMVQGLGLMVQAFVFMVQGLVSKILNIPERQVEHALLPMLHSN